MSIILASQSPRRLFLLKSAGLDVEVQPSHIDETPLPNEAVQAMTLRLCIDKALACGISDRLVIAADTLVAIGDDVLGQPNDLAEAKAMIQRLSGHTHQVHTTVCVRWGDIYETQTVTTEVVFRTIPDEEIDVYIHHNDILDKAGAYAIQGGASGFIVGIQGSLDNVIGLPVRTTLALMKQVKQKAEMESGVGS